LRIPILSCVLLLAQIFTSASADAQIGRLRNMVAGVTKGEIYGLDVTDEDSPIVFVVDLTPVVELPPGAVDNLRQMAAEQGEAYVRRKLAEEGSDWALRAAGPAGMVVKEVMARRSDRAERARNHVRAAIEGLEEDQRFGIVTFEGEPRAWQSAPVIASEANREEARDFLGQLQKVEGDGFLQSALMAAAGFAVDPSAYADPQVQTAVIPGAPAAPSGATVSAENLLRGIELALALEPETIVVVVGAAPAEDPAGFVARVEELMGERDVDIYAAVFGEKQSGGVLLPLAEANDGELLGQEEEEEED
jgi:hypothetical protein